MEDYKDLAETRGELIEQLKADKASWRHTANSRARDISNMNSKIYRMQTQLDRMENLKDRCEAANRERDDALDVLRKVRNLLPLLVADDRTELEELRPDIDAALRGEETRRVYAALAEDYDKRTYHGD